MESWQVYHAARKTLPKGQLQAIYSRSASLIGLWAADPTYCEHHTRNPIDRLRSMLDAMDTAGVGDYARYAIDYMAEPLGGRFCPIDTNRSDKGTSEGEAMDALCALGRLTDTVREALADGCLDTEEIIKIKEQARTIKAEVSQLLDAAGIGGGV